MTANHTQIRQVGVSAAVIIFLFLLLGGVAILQLKLILPGAFALGAGFAGFTVLLLWRKQVWPTDAQRAAYLNWVVKKAAAVYEQHLSTTCELHWTEICVQNADLLSLIRNLRIELPELFFIQVLAAVGQISTGSLFDSATGGSNLKVLQIDGQIYKPKTGFSQILLSLVEDDRFKELPIQEWLVQTRRWTLELVSTAQEPSP